MIRRPRSRQCPINVPQIASIARTIRADARVGGPQSLQVVIEMRKVDQQERRRMPSIDADRGLGDPPARADVGLRPPEVEEWKRADLGDQPCAQVRGLRVDVENLAAVRRVDRARRHRPVGGAVHVEPPEHLGAGERGVAATGGFPHLLAVHELIRLPPEHHLREIAEVPAVADDAVVARERAGEKRRLRGAGDRGQ